jgi:hypothetical protein
VTRRERIRYEMFQRVRDFGTAHRDVFPNGSAGAQAFAKVADAVAAFETHLDAKSTTAAQSRQTKTTARNALKARMRGVIRTSRGVARVAADGREALRMPVRRSDIALLTAARACVEAAKPIEADCMHLGLPATFLADLRDAIDDYERVIRDRRTHRDAAAAAQKGITAAIADGFAAIRTLDIVVTNAVEKDPERFAAWRRDRRLVGDTRKKRRTK